MKHFTFPQEISVPKQLKHNVMAHVVADIGQRPQMLKRSKLLKILVPNVVVLSLIVGVFSFLDLSHPSSLSTTNSGIIASSVSSQSVADQSESFQQTLNETEKILNDLSLMSEEI